MPERVTHRVSCSKGQRLEGGRQTRAAVASAAGLVKDRGRQAGESKVLQSFKEGVKLRKIEQSDEYSKTSRTLNTFKICGQPEPSWLKFTGEKVV